MMEEITSILSVYGPLLAEAVVMTLTITAGAYAIGFALGLPLAIVRTYGGRTLRSAAAAYIEVIRGTPMVVQLFLVYYAAPAVGIMLPPAVAAILALGLNSAAYQAEYFRAAFQAVAKAQWEAALSIGLSEGQALRTVILPQSMRIVLPALTNELVYMLKYSSISYFITVPELVYVGKFIGSRTFMYTEVYALIAVIYVVFSLAFTEGMRAVEKKFSIPGISITPRT